LGVASTQGAGAEQIPGTPDASSSSAVDAAAAPADVDPDLTPPPVLPWGAVPQPIRKGRAGASSTTLRAAGLVAADADTSGSDVPKPEFAPKGRSGKNTFLKSETTDVPPDPAPSASASPTPASTAGDGTREVDFLYNVASQAADVDGFYSSLTIAKPTLAKADYHSLAELALESADGKQIVEFGWNVDRGVNGDEDPHLFVYRWVNRKTSCYNGCGFVQYSTNVKPGDTVAYGSIKKFGIQYFNGAWWVAFDSEWIGYFPETIWNEQGVSFSKGGYQQVFGEVAASSLKPCGTQMGNGTIPSATTGNTAALVTSMAFLNGPTVAMDLRSTSDIYDVVSLNNKTFRYGGPNANCNTATPTASATP
jgi:hypothetical protein